MILSLLLAASVPLDFGTSQLVEPDHEHSWQLLIDDEVGKMPWDEASIKTQSFEDTSYPTLLMRAQFRDKSIPWDLMDVHVAIDCDTGQLATIERFATHRDGTEPYREVETSLKFESVPEKQSVGTGELMRAVCGEDWTA